MGQRQWFEAQLGLRLIDVALHIIPGKPDGSCVSGISAHKPIRREPSALSNNLTLI
jgi:hypothetical protein